MSAYLGQANKANARGRAGKKLRMGDATTYLAPDQSQGHRRQDAALVWIPLTNEVDALIEEQYQGRRVRVKNTSGSSWGAGTMLAPATAGALEAAASGTATSSPNTGTSVVITVTASVGAFAVGQLVIITTSATLVEYAIIAAVTGTTITVDVLSYNHVNPTIVVDPAHVAVKANATGGILTDWVNDVAIANGAYGWAYGAIEVGSLDTHLLTLGAAVYLNTAAGGYSTTAPSGTAVCVQTVGIVKIVDAAVGVIKFFPGLHRILATIGGMPPTVTAGYLLVDQGAGITPIWKVLSGDATITSAGVLTIANNAITNAKVLNVDASKITTGLLALARGGTNADLSATGGANQIVKQVSVGGALTVAALVAADIPVLDASKITTGLLALARGGTNADLSATGGVNQIVKQVSVGGALTVAALVAGDIPSLDASKLTTGQLALARGGTNADLSATGGANQFVRQNSVGGAFTVSALAQADLPAAGADLTQMASRARPFKNIIINGDMRFAQRQIPGTVTAVLTEKYGADRWKSSSTAGSVGHKRFDTDGVLETGLGARYYSQWSQNAGSHKFFVCQPIESADMAYLRGRTIICQAKIKASAAKTIRFGLIELGSGGSVDVLPVNVITAEGAGSTDPTLGANLTYSTSVLTNVVGGTVSGNALSCSATTVWAQFAFKVTVGTTCKNLLLAIWTDGLFATNDTFSISEVGLFDGDQVREWLPEVTEVELAKCQRFFCKSYPVDTAPATASIGGYVCGPASSTSSIRTGYHFPVEMRGTPTMLIYSYAGSISKVTVSGGGDTGAAAIGNDITTTGSGSTTDSGAPYIAGTVYFFHTRAESEL